jgi:hypothetical protein
MGNDDRPVSLWIQIKCYIFMKLGENLWQYVLVHKDYWHKPYGVSFTHRRDFPKLFKYDMVDMNDDIELELEKKR